MTSSPLWDNLPSACRILPNWVLWRVEERDGRLTKVPYDKYGSKASSKASHTWTHLDDARKAFESGKGEGIGFVFTRISGISGVDLDHCRDPTTGEIDTWARTYLDRLNSYSEVSPSGTGIHVLVKGSDGIPITGEDGGRQKSLKGDGYRQGAKIEMYSAKRFFTMTGQRLAEYSPTAEDRQDELIAIYNEVFGPAQEEHKSMPSMSTEREHEDSNNEHLTDEQVIARMLSSANADEIEALFVRGDTSANGGDDSAADLALCNYLAFWTAKNRLQMDRIFRQSKLMRPKWDEKRGRQTYGERTIDEAIRGTKEAYEPDYIVDEDLDDDTGEEESSSSQPVDRSTKTKKPKKGRPTTIQRVINVLLGKVRQDEGSRLVITGTSKAYLWVSASDHRQLFDLDSEDFRIWLVGQYADQYNGAILRTSTIKDAKEALISQLSRHREPIRQEMQLRTTKKDDAIYYDLGDNVWQCVKISPSAVEVTPMPLGLKRTRTQGAQIMPDLTAKPEDLDELVSEMRIDDEYDRLLIKVIACAGMMPDIPHPILWITGGQGSGKSLRAWMLKSLIDPSILKQTSLPDNRKDLGVLLSNCYCLIFDNVDAPFTSWQVEQLCQAVTGGSQVARELFSDGEIAINSFNRGILIFTSIGIVTNAPDLLDRAIILPVDDIPANERRSENKLRQEFEKARPKILGATFKSIKCALAILPQVEEEFERGDWEQVRMADFAIFGEALARGAWNKKPGEFLEAYRKRINEASSEVVGGDLAMSTLQQFMQERIVWSGTAKELLRELQSHIRYEDPQWLPPNKGWPRTPNALGMKLKKYAVDLERQGIKVTYPDRKNKARNIEIELVSRDAPADEAEEEKITQLLIDHESKGAPIKLEAFANLRQVDKLAVARIIHSRLWRYDSASKLWSPPLRT